ncbi:MAG: hypothetical protein R2778_05820 [Saprospiraceae bacterium]
MPEHDDGQLVLFLEKRNMDEAVHLVPQLGMAETALLPVLLVR